MTSNDQGQNGHFESPGKDWLELTDLVFCGRSSRFIQRYCQVGENVTSFLPNKLFEGSLFAYNFFEGSRPHNNLVGNGEFRDQTKYPNDSWMAQSATQVILFQTVFPKNGRVWSVFHTKLYFAS